MCVYRYTHTHVQCPRVVRSTMLPGQQSHVTFYIFSSLPQGSSTRLIIAYHLAQRSTKQPPDPRPDPRAPSRPPPLTLPAPPSHAPAKETNHSGQCLGLCRLGTGNENASIHSLTDCLAGDTKGNAERSVETETRFLTCVGAYGWW